MSLKEGLLGSGFRGMLGCPGGAYGDVSVSIKRCNSFGEVKTYSRGEGYGGSK